MRSSSSIHRSRQEFMKYTTPHSFRLFCRTEQLMKWTGAIFFLWILFCSLINLFGWPRVGEMLGVVSNYRYGNFTGGQDRHIYVSSRSGMNTESIFVATRIIFELLLWPQELKWRCALSAGSDGHTSKHAEEKRRKRRKNTPENGFSNAMR
jgi:hypothetical protein